MATPPLTLDQALALVEQLSPADQLRLIARLAPHLEHALTHPAPPRTPLYGRFAPYGSAPSADDIDAARQDMWSGFPREDV
ncbi:MAG: hypothetical protein HC828_03275 [Blastochloris sp.]|nr:hypothetical protein [Blastochloris sp.]